MIDPLVAVSGLLALAVVVATLRFPLTGILAFVAVAALLPSALLPVPFVVAPSFIDLILLALLLAWLLRLASLRLGIIWLNRATGHDDLASQPRRRSQDRPAVWQRLPAAHWLVALFIGLAVVSLVLGTRHSFPSTEQVGLFLKMLNAIVFFYSAMQVVRSQPDLVRVVASLILAGAAAATIALVLYVLPRHDAIAILEGLAPLGYPTGPNVLRPIAGTDVLRATGTAVDPNLLGGVLMVVGALVAAQVFCRQPILPRVLLGALAAPIGAALVLTYSRGAWIGLAAAVLFIAIFQYRRAWWLVGLGTAAVLILPQAMGIRARLSDALLVRDRASLMRVDEYGDALEIAGRFPVFGVGFGEAPQVSSVYLTIVERMGLVGIATFAAILVLALARLFSSGRRGAAGDDGVLAGVCATMIAAVVAALFDHYFFTVPHMVALFWLILALLFIATKLTEIGSPADLDRRSPEIAGSPFRSPPKSGAAHAGRTGLAAADPEAAIPPHERSQGPEAARAAPR